MENKNLPVKPIATTWGLYYALFSIAIIVILYVTNMEKNFVIGALNVGGSIAVFIFGIKAYKQSNNDNLSLSQALKTGLGIAVIGGLIIALYSYIHYSYIQPEFLENMKTLQIEELAKQGSEMTSEQADLSMTILEISSSAGFISTVSVIGSLIFGLIVSLIAGLVMKSE